MEGLRLTSYRRLGSGSSDRQADSLCALLSPIQVARTATGKIQRRIVAEHFLKPVQPPAVRASETWYVTYEGIGDVDPLNGFSRWSIMAC